MLAAIADRPPPRRPFRPRVRVRPASGAIMPTSRTAGCICAAPGSRGDDGRCSMFQSAPGSSAPLSGLIEGLAADREVIAPDYLGNGDSAKPRRNVDIALLARDARQLADRLGLAHIRPVGHPHRRAGRAGARPVRRPSGSDALVLEAPPLLPADFSQDILANYLPPLVPDKWGLHVQQAWNMRRDMFLFWPWYRQQRDAVRPLGLPDDATLHDWTVGLLKSGRTYDLSYRAAFEYPTAAAPSAADAAGADLRRARRHAGGRARARTRHRAGSGHAWQPTPATVWYPNQTPGSIAETVAIYETFLRRPRAITHERRCRTSRETGMPPCRSRSRPPARPVADEPARPAAAGTSRRSRAHSPPRRR